jgi:hypothetical protein
VDNLEGEFDGASLLKNPGTLGISSLSMEGPPEALFITDLPYLPLPPTYNGAKKNPNWSKYTYQHTAQKKK